MPTQDVLNSRISGFRLSVQTPMKHAGKVCDEFEAEQFEAEPTRMPDRRRAEFSRPERARLETVAGDREPAVDRDTPSTELVRLHFSLRRSQPHRLVGHEAERAARRARRFPPHRHPRPGDATLRAFAFARAADRQVVPVAIDASWRP